MNRGGVGARSLNVELRAALNPAGERKVARFGWAFAPSDKVMQIESHYGKDVYNGDIGLRRRCRSRHEGADRRFRWPPRYLQFGKLAHWRLCTPRPSLVRVQVRPSTNSSVKTHGLFLCAINPRGKFSRVNPRANGYPISSTTLSRDGSSARPSRRVLRPTWSSTRRSNWRAAARFIGASGAGSTAYENGRSLSQALECPC